MTGAARSARTATRAELLALPEAERFRAEPFDAIDLFVGALFGDDDDAPT